MNRWEKEARAFGYVDALTGATPNPSFYPPEARAQYRSGYQDGEAIRAARSGEIPLATLPRLGRGWPTHRTVPRLMLADDITRPGDWERSRLKDMEQSKLRENAYYFMKYIMATDALNFAVPSYVLEVLKDTERQAKVVTGIDLASRPDETVGIVVSRQKFEREKNLRISRLAESLAPKWNDCGQCEGTGTTQNASDLQDEECPVCDGSGLLP